MQQSDGWAWVFSFLLGPSATKEQESKGLTHTLLPQAGRGSSATPTHWSLLIPWHHGGEKENRSAGQPRLPLPHSPPWCWVGVEDQPLIGPHWHSLVGKTVTASTRQGNGRPPPLCWLKLSKRGTKHRLVLLGRNGGLPLHLAPSGLPASVKWRRYME